MASTTVHLPEYSAWVGSPMWNDHLNNHGESHMTVASVEGCPSCATRPMLKALHAAIMAQGSHPSRELLEVTWALQDGYGIPGSTPSQGWDWSGIRDSSPAATKRMYDAMVTLAAEGRA